MEDNLNRMVVDLAKIKIQASVPNPDFDKGYETDVHFTMSWDIEALKDLNLHWKIAKKFRKLAEKMEYGLLLYDSGREVKATPDNKKLNE